MKPVKYPIWTWDKICIGQHIYTIVLLRKKSVAAILWSSMDIDGDLWRAGYKEEHELQRDRGLSEDLAGQYVLMALDRSGLMLPNQWFKTVIIPYAALLESHKYKVGYRPDFIKAYFTEAEDEA